ncbi:Alpha/Beta hydrolase protein [Clohesyomyces aquaticus]|uniref:Carboxypeptidase n=1 Tax=Clohesyomyces aquaticus TaxID=1231657 RepID=A0A1Y1ZQU2_9PLEO|nr:Alpha/Beta hydrolase protein [Clohesyomyces aquaticus]
MRASILVSLIFPILAFALPPPPQRPLLLDELKNGRVDPSDIRRECFATFDDTANKNETVCVNTVVQIVPNSAGLDWGSSIQYCGYVDYATGNADPHYFFWLVMSENSPEMDPLVLWLNGGPGASSLLGLFDQWGPRRIVGKKKLKENKNRMTESINWLFLENPTGVGFSYAQQQPRTSKQAATQVERFLSGFFATTFKHPSGDVKFNINPLHVAGESYAGHYVPAIGAALVENHAPWRLRSLIIGNGMVDLEDMTRGTSDLICSDPPLAFNPKPARCNKQDAYVNSCYSVMEQCKKDPHMCRYGYSSCRDGLGFGWAENLETDLYDFTKTTKQGAARKTLYEETFKEFINGMKALFGLERDIAWTYMNTPVWDAFVESGDWTRSYLPELGTVLSAGINVLLYAGDVDLAVPYTTVERTAYRLDWVDAPGQTSTARRDHFRECMIQQDEAHRTKLMLNDVEYGSYVKYGQLTYARVYGAGHMINENKPKEAKDMFEKWILRNSFLNCK